MKTRNSIPECMIEETGDLIHMWIIKASGCYLGNKDKLVDDANDAHKHKYKKDALTHATTWSIFHQWIDGREIDMKVVKAPK